MEITYIDDWIMRKENVHQFVRPEPLHPNSNQNTGTEPAFRQPIYLFFWNPICWTKPRR
jgi:hypothetical protein